MELTDVLESRIQKCRKRNCKRKCGRGGLCVLKRKRCPIGYFGFPPSGKRGKRCCCINKPRKTCKQLSGRKCSLNKDCGKGGKCDTQFTLNPCKKNLYSGMMEKTNRFCGGHSYVSKCCCIKKNSGGKCK